MNLNIESSGPLMHTANKSAGSSGQVTFAQHSLLLHPKQTLWMKRRTGPWQSLQSALRAKSISVAPNYFFTANMKVSVSTLLRGAIFLSLKTTTEQMHLNCVIGRFHSSCWRSICSTVVRHNPTFNETIAPSLPDGAHGLYTTSRNTQLVPLKYTPACLCYYNQL